MKGVQLKLQGEWLVMPPGFSIKLQQLNSVFNEEGVFSFPFEVPIEPNRHLFKNISDPFGNVKLKDVDGMEAELWFNGVLLYRGIIETEQEIEFGDTIPMTFLSGNSDFLSKIEGLNAQDVPLDREIKLGYVVTHAVLPSGITSRLPRLDLPRIIMMNYTEYNVSDPYPIKEYCNVRVCASDEDGKYKILDAKRPYSGVCFYVLYLLDCLFKHISISVRKNELSMMEDMSRLAFFTTKCHTYMSEKERNIPLSEIRKTDFCGNEFNLIFHKNKLGRGDSAHVEADGFTYKGNDLFATNKNFPDLTIKDLIEDLNTAFGVKMMHDSRTNSVDIIYLKNVLSDTEILDLNISILNVVVIKDKGVSTRITYGKSDDTAFNYTDYKSAKVFDNYPAILSSGISSFNTICAIDETTGNAYRVKVNKETGGDPALFEVGGFRDYISGDSKSEEIKEMSINFAPVIVNDAKGGETYGRRNDRRPGTSAPPAGEKEDQVLGVFTDVELSSKDFEGRLVTIYGGPASYSDWVWQTLDLKARFQETYDFLADDESPLQKYDAGYTIGIMRGPGNKSGVEYVKDYDGEGNSAWTQVVSNYAFTSDSCDNYGRFFDYNGTEAGGADQSGRFSLKLVAGKEDFPVGSEYANRGLVDKFLADYFYFLEHKKTVMLEVDMNITQLLNINFLKRYKIGDFVGFINKISYVLTVNGMEEVVIEMYTL